MTASIQGEITLRQGVKIMELYVCRSGFTYYGNDPELAEINDILANKLPDQKKYILIQLRGMLHIKEDFTKDK
jgi:hypothetical protein